jgi:hypothetical protein
MDASRPPRVAKFACTRRLSSIATIASMARIMSVIGRFSITLLRSMTSYPSRSDLGKRGRQTTNWLSLRRRFIHDQLRKFKPRSYKEVEASDERLMYRPRVVHRRLIVVNDRPAATRRMREISSDGLASVKWPGCCPSQSSVISGMPQDDNWYRETGLLTSTEIVAGPKAKYC